MANVANSAVNKYLIDNLLRGQSNAVPATLYWALIVASKGYAAVSTAYAVGDTVVPATPNGRIYKCTTAGTSGSSAPSWPTTAGATVTDGTVVWTEQTPAMLAGTFTEASYTGYARVGLAASLANWAGTQGAGTTAASSGTSGQSSNNTAVTFGAPTSAQTGLIAGVFLMDASSGGNPLYWSVLTTPKTVNNGDAAPSFPAGSFTLTYQ